jgi:hypothetical protein
MREIKDKDILEVFKLGEKNPGDKVFHGVLRQEGKIMIVYERNGGEPYSGFQEKFIFDITKLSEKQLQYLRDKGYEL